MEEPNNNEKVYREMVKASFFVSVAMTFGMFLICLLVSWLLTLYFQDSNVWVGALILFGVWVLWGFLKMSSRYVALLNYLEYRKDKND